MLRRHKPLKSQRSLAAGGGGDAGSVYLANDCTGSRRGTDPRPGDGGVLDRPDWLDWLELTRPESELLRSLTAGNLTAEQVR